MSDFNSLFPSFLSQCSQLKSALMPVAYLLLVVGMVASTITGHRSPGAYLRTFGRSIVYVALLTYLVTWGNQITQIISDTTTQVIQADPAQVFAEYNAALVAKKSTATQSSWSDKLFHMGATLFEAIVSGFLWLFGLLASVIMFYAYIIQKMILYLGYSLSPIFIGFLAIRSLSTVGQRYIVGLVGVMAWPLGWALASIVTQGLLTFMTDQSFMQSSTLSGTANYGLQNFIGVGLLGVWLIFSTIAAPVIIQKALTEGYQAGAELLSGASTAGLAGLSAGATTTATIGSRSDKSAFTAGLMVAAGASAATSGLVGSALGKGYGQSLLGTLAYQNGSCSKRAGEADPTSPRFSKDDITGAKAAKRAIEGSKGD
ncbi:MAG: hypothetical protein ACLQU4_15055 [Limisphaerales bacterium]